MDGAATNWLLDLEESLAAAMGPRYAVVCSWARATGADMVSIDVTRRYPAHRGHLFASTILHSACLRHEEVRGFVGTHLRNSIRFQAVLRFGLIFRKRYRRMAGK